MSQLLISAIPGFTDISDAAITSALGNLASLYPGLLNALLTISHNAKFAAVRPEVIPMGFYGPGDTVPAPPSLVDGYQYSYPECVFVAQLYSMRQPLAGYTPGQVTPPALANLDLGSGNPIVSPYVVDANDANGKVTLQEYFLGGTYGSDGGGGGGAFNQGTVKVFAICQRLSVNLPAGVSGD